MSQVVYYHLSFNHSVYLHTQNFQLKPSLLNQYKRLQLHFDYGKQTHKVTHTHKHTQTHKEARNKHKQSVNGLNNNKSSAKFFCLLA